MRIKAALAQAAALVHVGLAWDHHPQCRGILQAIQSGVAGCTGSDSVPSMEVAPSAACDVGSINSILRNGDQFCHQCAHVMVYVKPAEYEWEMGRLFYNSPPYAGAWESLETLGNAFDKLCFAAKDGVCMGCGYS
ncbi:uncharacterized protein UV8b_00225 [Ustilaginoidea virens]|uniref:Uncharacterized protein n=1 Tax=Ustilaginoidea virens TaxID=1159556 RepID=A0A8E5HIF6_USTVR|nr:uncharacterized protein UV8b_00225 [Ustilaginoidea virens]QUC15984.1 hypothetical protein UV8b_00225 [Ustilaginoidea virens]